jgi:hypothetical protein
VEERPAIQLVTSTWLRKGDDAKALKGHAVRIRGDSSLLDV